MRSLPKRGLFFGLFLLAVAMVFASGSPGLRPRAAATDYPVHGTAGQTALGAAVIPGSEVKKMLATDLNSAGYVVIEVGVFPGVGEEVDLSPADFTLLAGTNAISERPADAEAIAAVVTKTNRTGPQTDDSIHGTARAAVGIGSNSDPITGRRINGTSTAAGGGVGVGTPAGTPVCRTVNCDGPMGLPIPPAAEPVPESTRARIEQELWEKSLPDGKTAKAVAGYLYFPKPSGKAKNAA
jgi:hypothetical protein